MALPSGLKNVEFEFTAANRANTAMVRIFHVIFLMDVDCDLDG